MKMGNRIIAMFFACTLLCPFVGMASSQISNFNLNGDSVSLQVELEPGGRYQLRGSDDLAAGEWTSLGSSFIAESSSTNLTAAAAEPAYFYTVVEVSGYISAISASNNVIYLAIDTTPDERYQLWGNGDLTSTNWVEIGEPFDSEESSIIKEVPMMESTYWYRVQELIDPTDPITPPPPPPGG